MGVKELGGQIGGIATDLRHRTRGFEREPIVATVDGERERLCSHRIEIEGATPMSIKETDERSNRGAASIVLCSS